MSLDYNFAWAVRDTVIVSIMNSENLGHWESQMKSLGVNEWTKLLWQQNNSGQLPHWQEMVKKVWKENQKRYRWSDGGQLDKRDGEDVQRNNKSLLNIQA